MSGHTHWMKLALALAAKGAGEVHPNPMVGAVVVRGGRVIGRGFHRRYGSAHAEVEALRHTGSRARGSTVYVTLEPCAHWGKTPPCVMALQNAGVRHVVAAMQDPNPAVSGKGFKALRRAGIRVTAGVLEDSARRLNRAFITRIRKGRPYVTLKMATSLDGKMSTVTGESKWITSVASRRAGHQLRSEVDAIAVGSGTALKDNPHLTSHGIGKNPVRIIFTSRRKLPKSLNVFNREAATWTMKGKPLLPALRRLAREGVTHLLVEGGPTLQKSFLDADVVDEIVWFIAPVIIGGKKRLKDAPRIAGAGDICIRGDIER